MPLTQPLTTTFKTRKHSQLALNQKRFLKTKRKRARRSEAQQTCKAKTGGAIITWKYQTPPYLDDASEIYSQMRNAYLCGAKYIVVFNYYSSDSGPYGTMQDEHFQAVQDLWNNVVRNADEKRGSIQANSAVVFPHNYAWGGRWAQDNIWGIFKADNRTVVMWDTMQSALQTHKLNLDIVYDDPNYPFSEKYQYIYNLTK